MFVDAAPHIQRMNKTSLCKQMKRMRMLYCDDTTTFKCTSTGTVEVNLESWTLVCFFWMLCLTCELKVKKRDRGLVSKGCVWLRRYMKVCSCVEKLLWISSSCLHVAEVQRKMAQCKQTISWIRCWIDESWWKFNVRKAHVCLGERDSAHINDHQIPESWWRPQGGRWQRPPLF